MTSRRSFIKTAVGAGALLGLGADRSLLANTARDAALNTARGRAKNIIFMVADGMNIGSLCATRHYQKLVLNQDNAWLSLYKTHPVVRSLMETSSANSIVTDSSAASSSWGSGHRIKNGQVNMSAEDGRPLTPICIKVREHGIATGLVTTATITHATPAGFAANTKDRGDEKTIARQYLERRVDILLGGGQRRFDDKLQDDYRKAGYGLIKTRDELLAQSDAFAPLLGIFSGSYLPFTIDRNADPELQKTTPTLAEMARLALGRLSKAPNGFLLQIEGARVDHAGHANDAAALIHDQIAFDEAVAVARDFVDSHPDTLLVITTDHGCGGMNTNGMGNAYAGSTDTFLKLAKFTRSYGSMKDEAKKLSERELADYLENVTGIRFKGSKLQGLGLALDAVAAYSPKTMEENKARLANRGYGSLQEIFQTETGVGWTSGNHTGELVEFTALGPSAQRFAPLIRNDEVHNILLQSFGLAPG